MSPRLSDDGSYLIFEYLDVGEEHQIAVMLTTVKGSAHFCDPKRITKEVLCNESFDSLRDIMLKLQVADDDISIVNRYSPIDKKELNARVIFRVKSSHNEALDKIIRLFELSNMRYPKEDEAEITETEQECLVECKVKSIVHPDNKRLYLNYQSKGLWFIDSEKRQNYTFYVNNQAYRLVVWPNQKWSGLRDSLLLRIFIPSVKQRFEQELEKEDELRKIGLSIPKHSMYHVNDDRIYIVYPLGNSETLDRRIQNCDRYKLEETLRLLAERLSIDHKIGYDSGNSSAIHSGPETAGYIFTDGVPPFWIYPRSMSKKDDMIIIGAEAVLRFWETLLKVPKLKKTAENYNLGLSAVTGFFEAYGDRNVLTMMPKIRYKVHGIEPSLSYYLENLNL